MSELTPTTIRILPEHITDSKRGDPFACMVHEAIKDQLFPDGGTDIKIAVGYGGINFISGGEKTVIEETRALEDRISRFDNGQDVQPFQFDIYQDKQGTWHAGKVRNIAGAPVRNTKEIA